MLRHSHLYMKGGKRKFAANAIQPIGKQLSLPL
jgi:hypothetical protein